MQLSGVKRVIFPIPRCILRNSRQLHLSSSASLTKFPAIFRQEREPTLGKQPDVPKEYYVPRRFIPMTRRALVRRILEEEQLINPRDRNRFQELSDVLDKAIAGTLYGVLGELKALYDPLNPDKETLMVKSYSEKERKENEFWLLEKLSQLMEKAHFYELPREEVLEALKEHDVGDGVLVSVDPNKYDVLRIWVVGKEVEPVEKGPWFTWIFSTVKHWISPPPQVERYKRVVVAVRAKKQQKLMLKSFKDIHCPNIEYLLPDGKIRMNRFDQNVMFATVTVGVTSIVIKLVSFLADYNISWTYIATAVAGLICLRAWTAYKNKRNSYLVNLSRTLYFKSIANNRALLSLIADRAEDEIFKATLLAYSFLQAATRSTNSGDGGFTEGITATDLKEQIDQWMKNKFQVTVIFDPHQPIKQLETFGILQTKQQGDQQLLRVLPIFDAVVKMPSPVRMVEPSTYRMEELDVDEAEATTEEEKEQKQEKEREEMEEKSLKWH